MCSTENGHSYRIEALGPQTWDAFADLAGWTLTESGRVVSTGNLLYGELEIRGRRVAFYRFDNDGKTDWVNAAGRSLKGHLLRTPLACREGEGQHGGGERACAPHLAAAHRHLGRLRRPGGQRVVGAAARELVGKTGEAP